MLDALITYESFLNKYTASYGVMCVTLIALPFENGNCDKHHLKVFPVLLIVCTQMTYLRFLCTCGMDQYQTQ